jgi:molecular chaperone GrpE
MEDISHKNNTHPDLDMKDGGISPLEEPLSNTDISNTTEEDQPSAPNLLQQVEDLQKQLIATQDKYIRLYAEFENFRKRTTQEKLSLIETASEKLLQELLPILDDFERAIHAINQDHGSLEVAKKGMESIYHKMVHLLEKTGVKTIPSGKGSDFDPELHEAITKTPVAEKTLQGKIVDIAEKGYRLKNKVLRYAKVIIGE